MTDLFDALDRTPTVGQLARRTDPPTSHKAAAEVVASGTVSRMGQISYDELARQGPSTSSELERGYGCSDGRLRKRLPELRRQGRVRIVGVRKCSVTGKTAQVWEAIRT